MKRRSWTKTDKLKLALISVLVVVLTAGTVFAAFWVWSLRDPDKLQWFEGIIASLGLGGWFVLLAIQYIQIVVAFIPGGPIQIVAGALYGPWGGLAVCLVGTVLASATVFALVNRYGAKAIRFFVGDKDIKQYKFLQDSKRLEGLVFLLFLIPGTPKDALTYLFALTPIKMKRFMVLSVVARLPAMLTSILAGDQVIKGNWWQAGVLFAAITAISLLGLLLHKKIMRMGGVKQMRRNIRKDAPR